MQNVQFVLVLLVHHFHSHDFVNFFSESHEGSSMSSSNDLVAVVFFAHRGSINFEIAIPKVLTQNNRSNYRKSLPSWVPFPSIPPWHKAFKCDDKG